MIRTKGEAGTGDIVEAVKHIRTVNEDIAALQQAAEADLPKLAEEMRVPVALVSETRKLGRLPVVNFAAGGVAIPADAALMMQLGCDGVFVGSGILRRKPNGAGESHCRGGRPLSRPGIFSESIRGLGEAMRESAWRTSQ